LNAAWESLAVGVLALLVYARTLCRTVYVGDSGELIAAVHTLGIPHPPGYPLYVLLGKLFSVVVAKGNPAFRLNLFSACCAAAASGIWCLMLQLAGVAASAAAASALALAFGASLWSQATVARVYAPAAFAISLIFYFLESWNQHPQEIHWLALAMAATGAGMAIHPLVGGAFPGLILAVALRRPEVFRDAQGLKALGCVLPGLLTYAWIPLRARTKPLVRWGNLETMRGLVQFFLRREYWKFRYVCSPGKAAQVTAFYFRRFIYEYGVLGTIATLFGIPLLVRGSRPLLAMVVATAGANPLSMIAHARREDIFVWPRYMIGAWLALALPMAIGWSSILTFVPNQVRSPAAFVLPLILLASQFKHRDLSRHRYAEEYSERVLKNLPSDAILIAEDDNVLFPLMYLQYVLKLRPDVKLIDVAARANGPLTFNPGRDAVYCTHYQPAFVRQTTDREVGSSLIAEGLAYRLVRKNLSYQAKNLWPDALPPDMDDVSIPRDFMTRRLLAHACIMRAEWESRQDKAESEAWCIKAANFGWDCDSVQHNVGVILERLGLGEDAAHFLAAASRVKRNENYREYETG